MSEFRLKSVLEYRYITCKRGVIDSIISKLNYFGRPYTGVITDILTETASEAFVKSYYEADYQPQFEKINRRFSTLWTLTRSNLFKNIAAAINLKAERDFGAFFLVAGLSFAEYFFWNVCETDRAVAEYLAKDTVEALTASVLRKKAAETYKKGHTGEALEGFLKALELTPDDFTVSFQLGTYYFFEKADHIKAADYFAKSATSARGVSPGIEALALCFSALLLRLKALHRGERAMAADALTLCEKAVKAAPDLSITLYSRLQAIAGLCALGESSDVFLEEAEKVFAIDNTLLLQALLDNAFDPVLEPLAAMAVARYDEALAGCVRAIEETGRKLSLFPSRLETNADTAKVFHLKKEFNAAREYFKKNKTCSDIEEIVRRIEKVSAGADQVLFSNRVQQKLTKVREYCSAIVNEFKKDFGDRMKPYNDAIKKRQELAARIEAVNKKYFHSPDFPPAGEDGPEAADNGNAGGASSAEPDEGAKKTPEVRNPAAVKSIRSSSSTFVFAAIEAVLIALWLPAGIMPLTLFVMATAVNACLAPAYALAGVELFYFITAMQLDELKREYSKLDLRLDLSNNLPGEAEMKAREKYSKQIAGEFSISHIDARNILESALMCDYERMKAIIRTICK